MIILLLFSLIIIYIKPSIIYILFALEMLLLGISNSLVFGSVGTDDFIGQITTLILFSAAASEMAIGLMLLINMHSYYNMEYYKSNLKQE